MTIDAPVLLNPVIEIARDAGDAILDIYRQPYEVHEKTDGSPVTTADQRAHNLIQSRLTELTATIPILSEESVAREVESRRQWQTFWLVDPLDGTKEFIRKNDEFTVNIALMDQGIPVLGVVHTPALAMTHYAARGAGAFKQVADNEACTIRCKSFDPTQVTMVASRAHSGAEVEHYKNELSKVVDHLETRSMGSALKICLVAEGAADVYPRLGLTSEWDTGAAHCVINEAGGQLVNCEGVDLKYNKENILNPWFLAIGDPNHNWLSYLP